MEKLACFFFCVCFFEGSVSEITSCQVLGLAKTDNMAARGGSVAPEHPVLVQPGCWVETERAAAHLFTDSFTI